MASRLLAAQRRRGAFPANATLRVTDHAPTIHYDSDAASSRSGNSEVDEETRRQQQEEEDDEENELSKRHGEAAEARGGSSKKRDASATTTGKTDAELEAEYAKAAARAKKKPRPTLTIPQLIGPNGLIRIRQEFPSQLRYPRCRSANVRQDVDAAATYSRKLVAAYQSFAYDLCPSLAFEDFLIKVDTFGSKKEMKAFLQNMRDDIRNAHVERLYGKEKAEKMMQDLDMGLKQQSELFKQHLSQHGGEIDSEQNQETMSDGGAYPNEEESNDVQPQVELPRPIMAAVAGASTFNPYQTKSSSSDRARLSTSSTAAPSCLPIPTSQQRKPSHIMDDEEEEAVFDDIQGMPREDSSPQQRLRTAQDEESSDPLDDNLQSTPKDTHDDLSLVPMPNTGPATPLRDSQSDEEEEASFDDVQGKAAFQKQVTCPKVRVTSANSTQQGTTRSDNDDEDESVEGNPNQLHSEEETAVNFDDFQGKPKELSRSQAEGEYEVTGKVVEGGVSNDSSRHLVDEEEVNKVALQDMSTNATRNMDADNANIDEPPSIPNQSAKRDKHFNAAHNTGQSRSPFKINKNLNGDENEEETEASVEDIQDKPTLDAVKCKRSAVDQFAIILEKTEPDASVKNQSDNAGEQVSMLSSLPPPLDTVTYGEFSSSYDKRVKDFSSTEPNSSSRCAETCETDSLLASPQRVENMDESSSKLPFVLFAGTQPSHDCSKLAYTQPSQDYSVMASSQPSQDISRFVPFGQQSQEGPSLMSESSQTFPELPTQANNDDATLPSSQFQNPLPIMDTTCGVSQDVSLMDETATIIATQADTIINTPFTLPSQSQSQNNPVMMDFLSNEDETATVVPTMSAPTQMDES